MDTSERPEALLDEALRNAAHRDLGSAGEAPDNAELQVYLAGEMPEEQAEQVRAWLVANKEGRERLVELAPFVEARPPAADAPADLEEEAAWRALQRRLDSSSSSPKSSPPPVTSEPIQLVDTLPTTNAGRWWQALAAVLALATGLLLLRVFHLESKRNPQNMRKLDLVADARGGRVESFPIVPGEPFLVEISPGAPRDECETYRVQLLDLKGRVLSSREDLRLTDHVLRFLLSAQPGEVLLTVSACDEVLDKQRIDLVADRP